MPETFSCFNCLQFEYFTKCIFNQDLTI